MVLNKKIAKYAMAMGLVAMLAAPFGGNVAQASITSAGQGTQVAAKSAITLVQPATKKTTTTKSSTDTKSKDKTSTKKPSAKTIKKNKETAQKYEGKKLSSLVKKIGKYKKLTKAKSCYYEGEYDGVAEYDGFKVYCHTENKKTWYIDSVE